MKTNRLFLCFILLGILFLQTCKKVEKEMLVSTGTVSNILTTTADVSGKILDLGQGATLYGHCYSKTTNPTISDSRTERTSPALGDFTSTLEGLDAGTKYYVKAYLSRGKDVVYGNEINFTTASAALPELTTTAITTVTKITAVSGGNITNQGGTPVTARGVCWSLATITTLTNNKTTDGTGTGIFNSDITGLTPGTNYYLRAYATNSGGTKLGNEITFTTTSDTPPTVTTASVSSITSISAVCGGEVTNEGSSAVTARGICWNTVANPTIINFTTLDNSGIGSFVSNLTGLLPGTTYSVRAYATNSAGTSYGTPEYSFTTLKIPTIITTTISSITSTSASTGGIISSDGGAMVTARGVCWSTSSTPTVANSKTSNGSGTGTFTSSLSGLTTNTLYHVRAYATNSVGTSYGNEQDFTTDPVVVTDINGNIYDVIRIGAQLWTKENLITTYLNNGSFILPTLDPYLWSLFNHPTYISYSNPSSYGFLYNWFAVNTGNLCPTGWHVPTDNDWTTMIDYLGGAGVAGGKLKESGTAHWQSPNNDATNETGFTALPGGERSSTGAMQYQGTDGFWWSSTPETSTTNAWYRMIGNAGGIIPKYSASQYSGFSVRCIKDN